MSKEVEPVEPSTAAVAIIHNGFLSTLNNTVEVLRAEAVKMARAEKSEQMSDLRKALRAGYAALDQEINSKPFGEPKLQLMRIRTKIREAAEAVVPGAGDLYEVCSHCNLGGHVCRGCGEELGHLDFQKHNAGMEKCYE